MDLLRGTTGTVSRLAGKGEGQIGLVVGGRRGACSGVAREVSGIAAGRGRSRSASGANLWQRPKKRARNSGHSTRLIAGRALRREKRAREGKTKRGSLDYEEAIIGAFRAVFVRLPPRGRTATTVAFIVILASPEEGRGRRAFCGGPCCPAGQAARLAVLGVRVSVGHEVSKEGHIFRATTASRREIGCPSAKGPARPRRTPTLLPVKLPINSTRN